MKSFIALAEDFAGKFSVPHFPPSPEGLYQPGEYFLRLGGKRIRPVLCLMGNELFNPIHPDAWEVATAVELFHNFTLIHDDIMDKAPLRRGLPTVHTKYGESTALLTGDVMLITAYEYLSKITPASQPKILSLFNRTAKEVCEGQQIDMEFEKLSFDHISMDAYLQMITLKTSVLLAASLKMGAILGGAGEGNADHLYAFGKNLGIAFQIQDDLLDAFGDPEKFGKQKGGDIMAGKKTFLLLKAYELCDAAQRQQLLAIINSEAPDKVERTLDIFRRCKVDAWAEQEKARFAQLAMDHLEAIAVLSVRKQPLRELSGHLLNRQR